MKKQCVIISLLSFLTIGCAQMNNEDMGVLSGAMIGGTLGNTIGKGPGKFAATASGALIGSFLGGAIGRTMDRLDRIEMQRALEDIPTGRTATWNNPDTGNHYEVKPVKTYYVDHQPCREYITQAIIGGRSQQIYGKACRQADGSWKITA